MEKKTVRGIFWRFSEEISTRAVSFIVTIILARMLVPADYSLVSLSAIIISVAGTLIDSGLSVAIIQKGNADSDDYSTAFTFSFTVSVVLYLLTFLFAPVLGTIYDSDELVVICRVLCLVLIVNSVKGIFHAALRANLDFRKLFFSSFIGTLCSAVVGIGLAGRGYGAWALVAQQLTDAALDALIMGFASGLKIRFYISRTKLQELFRYSKNILAAGITSNLLNMITPVFISLRFSTLDLCFYSKAKGLSGLMLSFIETPLSQVIFPTLSKVKDDNAKFMGILHRFYVLLYFFTLPALLGLYVVAEDFVVLLFTEKWLEIVPYMHVFIIAMVFNKNIQGIKAIGRSDLYLNAILFSRAFSLLCLGAALALSKSPLGIAWAFVPKAASFFFVQVYLENKYLGYHIKDQCLDMFASLIPAVIMAFLVHVFSGWTVIAGLRLALRFAIKIVFGVVIYFVLSLLFNRKALTLILRKRT